MMPETRAKAGRGTTSDRLFRGRMTNMQNFSMLISYVSGAMQKRGNQNGRRGRSWLPPFCAHGGKAMKNGFGGFGPYALAIAKTLVKAATLTGPLTNRARRDVEMCGCRLDLVFQMFGDAHRGGS